MKTKTNIKIVLLLLIIFGFSIYTESSKQPAPRVQQDYKIVKQPKVIGVAQQAKIDADAALALGVLNEAGSRLAEEQKQWEQAKALLKREQDIANIKYLIDHSSYGPNVDPMNPDNWESIRLCIIQRESGGIPNNTNGSIHTYDPVDRSAGLYQFMASTWKMYGGYYSGNQAPVEIQDERFWQVWNKGLGRNNWRSQNNYKPCWLNG